MNTSSGARQFVTWASLAAVLIVLLPAFAAGQEPVPPAIRAPGTSQRLLALDIFGGWALCCDPIETPGTGEDTKESGGSGWEVGATVFYGRPWLGFRGTVGRTTTLDLPVWQVTAGPQVSTGKALARFMAHALVGYAKTSGVTPSQSSVVWAVGGGMDLAVLRIQIDYVRLSLDGLQKNNTRGFVGLVLPLCFRACGDYWALIGV